MADYPALGTCASWIETSSRPRQVQYRRIVEAAINKLLPLKCVNIGLSSWRCSQAGALWPIGTAKPRVVVPLGQDSNTLIMSGWLPSFLWCCQRPLCLFLSFLQTTTALLLVPRLIPRTHWISTTSISRLNGPQNGSFLSAGGRGCPDS